MEDIGNYGYTLFRTIPECGLSKGIQAPPQRISLARIGQEKEKAMAGGEVMSGKAEKKREQCDTKRSRIAPV